MDNSIVLALIRKDLDELHTLVEALEKEAAPNQLLIDISVAKAQTLFKEFSLLQGSIPDQTVLSSPEAQWPADTATPEEKPEVQKEVDEASEKQLAEATVQELKVDHAEKDPIVAAVEDFVETPMAEAVQEQMAESVAPQPQPQPQSQPEPEPEPQPQPEPFAENTTSSKKVLGERFTREASLNDRLGQGASSEPRIKGKPITSLKKAIGLNDKFMFTRELFGNDHSKFELSVDELDRCASLMDAIAYMEQNFQWTKNATSLKFIELVKMRFDQ
ncbi:MAG: hypothetical protein JXR22_08130 [Prolixibacteraceae bacterium]|nr:hypothetical protein [Prolixibacteraceae bacterium]